MLVKPSSSLLFSVRLVSVFFILINSSVFSQVNSILFLADRSDLDVQLIRSHEDISEHLFGFSSDKIYFSSNVPEQFSVNSKEKIKGGDQYRIFKIDANGDYKIQLGDQFFLPIGKGEGRFSFLKGNKEIFITLFSAIGKKKNARIAVKYFVSESGVWKQKPFELFDTISVPFKDPSISTDKKKLVFSAKFPDTFGGFDLYESRFENGNWTRPKNLGAKVNSDADDDGAFIDSDGNFYFISNRLGDADIYGLRNNEVIKIVSGLVSSNENETGFYFDPTRQEGYFSRDSSNVSKIFKFNIPIAKCTKIDTIKKETLCYEFEEETATGVKEDNNIGYEWDFGDNKKMKGNKVENCFDKTGKYLIQLNVIDKVTGTIFYNQSEYELEVNYEDEIQFDLKQLPDSSYVLSWQSRNQSDNSSVKVSIVEGGKVSGFLRESALSLKPKFQQFELHFKVRDSSYCYLVNEETLRNVLKKEKEKENSKKEENNQVSKNNRNEINEIFGVERGTVKEADSKFNYKINLGQSEKFYPDLLEDYSINKDLEIIEDSGHVLNYYVGDYDKISEAIEPTRDLFKKGLKTAEIVSFKNGKPENLSKTIKDKNMDNLVISEGYDLHFSFFYNKNESDLRPEELKSFRDFMTLIANKNLIIQVNSYTDYTGTEQHNEKLAKTRNKIVIDLLTSEFKVSDAQIGRKTKNNSPKFAKKGEPLDNQKLRRTDVYIRFGK